MDADNGCSLSHQPESCDFHNMAVDPGRTKDYTFWNLSNIKCLMVKIASSNSNFVAIICSTPCI